MKLHPDDPRLTGYLLGELPPNEAAEIERAVAGNPALKVALDDLTRVQRLLGDTLDGKAEERLHPWQREAIRRAAADAEASDKVIELPSRRRSWRPLLVVAAAVALAIGATWLMWRLPVGKNSPVARTPATPAPDWSDPKLELALLPLPGPPGGANVETGVGASGDSANLAETQEAALRDDPGGFLERIGKTLHGKPLPPPTRLRSWPERPTLDTRQSPSLRLPLIAGDFSYGWVRTALLDHHELPPPGAVRVGELVNHFNYAFARSGEADGVRLATESIRCPWDSDSVLTMISLNTEQGETSRVALQFDCDPQEVRRYRLLGFDRAASLHPDDATGEPDGTLLPGGHRIAMIIQSWPTTPGDQLAASVAASVKTDAQPNKIRLDASPVASWNDATPSARLAALTAGFGLHLRKSKINPPPSLARLAELAAGLPDASDHAPDPTPADLTNLIDAARSIDE